jgi:hypothetical protein
MHVTIRNQISNYTRLNWIHFRFTRETWMEAALWRGDSLSDYICTSKSMGARTLHCAAFHHFSSAGLKKLQATFHLDFPCPSPVSNPLSAHVERCEQWQEYSSCKRIWALRHGDCPLKIISDSPQGFGTAPCQLIQPGTTVVSGAEESRKRKRERLIFKISVIGWQDGLAHLTVKITLWKRYYPHSLHFYKTLPRDSAHHIFMISLIFPCLPWY